MYIPFLRTKDAELKAYEYLSDEIKESCLPLFELTRSRKTKAFEFGNIHEKMAKLIVLMGGRPFILDLCTATAQTNYQIEELLDPTNGFERWQRFLNDYVEVDLIPVIHLDFGDPTNTLSLAKALTEYNRVAYHLDLSIRDTTFLDMYLEMFDFLKEQGISFEKSCIVANVGFVEVGEVDILVERVTPYINYFNSLNPAMLIPISNCFPDTSNLTSRQNCSKLSGSFPVRELDITKLLTGSLKKHGDYASVFQSDAEPTPKSGFWPRVDYCRPDFIFEYERRQREPDGYVLAAKAIVSKGFYQADTIECWARTQINEASKNGIFGKSPAHWISVRSNLYMTRVANKLSAGADGSL